MQEMNFDRHVRNQKAKTLLAKSCDVVAKLSVQRWLMTSHLALRPLLNSTFNHFRSHLFSLPPSTMSEPLQSGADTAHDTTQNGETSASTSPPQSRPPPIPIPARQAPTAPRKNLTGLLGGRQGHHGSTPIPPSLQAKMAAVRI